MKREMALCPQRAPMQPVSPPKKLTLEKVLQCIGSEGILLSKLSKVVDWEGIDTRRKSIKNIVKENSDLLLIRNGRVYLKQKSSEEGLLGTIATKRKGSYDPLFEVDDTSEGEAQAKAEGPSQSLPSVYDILMQVPAEGISLATLAQRFSGVTDDFLRLEVQRHSSHLRISTDTVTRCDTAVPPGVPMMEASLTMK